MDSFFVFHLAHYLLYMMLYILFVRDSGGGFNQGQLAKDGALDRHQRGALPEDHDHYGAMS